MIRFLLALVLLLAFGAPAEAYTWAKANNAWGYRLVYPRELLKLVATSQEGDRQRFESKNSQFIVISAGYTGFAEPWRALTMAEGPGWLQDHPGWKVASVRPVKRGYEMRGTTRKTSEAFYELHTLLQTPDPSEGFWGVVTFTYPKRQEKALKPVIAQMVKSLAGR